MHIEIDVFSFLGGFILGMVVAGLIYIAVREGERSKKNNR